MLQHFHSVNVNPMNNKLWRIQAKVSSLPIVLVADILCSCSSFTMNIKAPNPNGRSTSTCKVFTRVLDLDWRSSFNIGKASWFEHQIEYGFCSNWHLFSTFWADNIQLNICTQSKFQYILTKARICSAMDENSNVENLLWSVKPRK